MPATKTKKKSTGKKSSAKKSSTRSSSGGVSARAEKNVEDFREALERNASLSRERIQEVADDAVKRGRMTRKDANDMVSKLMSRGRKQTQALVKEFNKTVEQARKDLEQARKQLEAQTDKATKRARRETQRAGRAVRDAADEPLAQADKLKRRTGAGFPITAYDELTAAQIRSRIPDLTKAETRKVRTHEKNGKARKSILDACDKRLA